MHVSGERLSQLTGIAAILRYPMADLDLLDDVAQHSDGDELDANRTTDQAEASAW
jgi:hypothetical protein